MKPRAKVNFFGPFQRRHGILLKVKRKTGFLIVMGVLLIFLPICKAHAQVTCVRDPNTGKWINPRPDIAPTCRIPSTMAPSANPTTPASGVIRVLESSGDVSFVPAEGWLEDNKQPHPPGSIPNALTAGSEVELKSLIRTGATGRLKVSLSSDETLQAGPNTDLMIERDSHSDKSSDGVPSGSGRTPAIRPGTTLPNEPTIIKLYKGFIRWTRNLIKPGGDRRYIRPGVLISPEGVMIMENMGPAVRSHHGIRNYQLTYDIDVEVFFGADTAGYIKVYSGSVSFSPYDTDKEIKIQHGEMLTFQANGSMTGPLRIPDE